ncbi:MAG TPA: putative nucleotidyltransferase substrate binding domain-containing protein [Solirubrobacteraceae bacterium]|jgi:CBS domain-containing protein|nr:putative nucleotidyltransferase substrate binding domain-containing protein [Solirubrobacteraceae bacterium]
MEHLDTFLAGHPPFDTLSAEQLHDLVGGATVSEQPTGALVLVEDGPPAPGLWVILTGSMELVHQGEAVQILEPGECFGQASLLTGMSPTFGVRAREPSTCALLGSAQARRLLGSEAGAAYVAETMRTRLTRTGHTVHALQEVGTTPVSAIMRPAVFAPAGATVAEAARRLSEEGPGALILIDDNGLAIVTDADVRAMVASDGFSPDAPLRTIARAPAPAVSPVQLAIEATIDMIAGEVEHLVVLDGGRVCGILCATDLLALEARSPIGLRHTILEAADEDHLAAAASRLPQQFLALSRAGVPSGDLGRVLSLAQDTVVARLIDFSLRDAGPAPLPWAWLDLGSAARREFTLASDQDNALAYGAPLPGEEAAADAYFARLGSEVNGGLARCGIGSDDNGVLAGNRRWRMAKGAWLRTFDECLSQPDESHLVRATVAFDFRPVAGGLDISAGLGARIRAARQHPQFMRLIARSAAGFPVALNFRGQLATVHDGERAGRLDIKRGAIIPLVNVVRYHALASGVSISPTLDRIEAIAGAGGVSRDDADALREAFEVITSVRFEHHAELISAGQRADNLIDPGALSPIARGDLRAALQAVRRAQRRLPV